MRLCQQFSLTFPRSLLFCGPTDPPIKVNNFRGSSLSKRAKHARLLSFQCRHSIAESIAILMELYTFPHFIVQICFISTWSLFIANALWSVCVCSLPILAIHFSFLSFARKHIHTRTDGRRRVATTTNFKRVHLKKDIGSIYSHKYIWKSNTGWTWVDNKNVCADLRLG